MPPAGVHFNGSVNLPDTETVMREISSRIPRGVRRVTDGETGERYYWIMFQVQKFAAMPDFQSAGMREPLPGVELPPMPLLRLADGVAAEDVHWPDLGYATAYTDSYQVFRRLQDDGTIAPGVRFQMQYPTPTAPIAGTFVPEDREGLIASYEAALFADLDRALARLPHEQIAVQWDVAVEFAMLVQVANAVTAAARRPVNFFSFTVPQAQRDSDYFAPLADLRTEPETELYFALVPYYPASQAVGTTAEQVAHIDKNLAKTSAGSRGWGICTECGMGRVQADDVPTLLDLHRTILDAHGANR